jgi:hypothetical protein
MALASARSDYSISSMIAPLGESADVTTRSISTPMRWSDGLWGPETG